MQQFRGSTQECHIHVHMYTRQQLEVFLGLMGQVGGALLGFVWYAAHCSFPVSARMALSAGCCLAATVMAAL